MALNILATTSIIIRKGTEAQITANPAPYQQEGELAYSTNTRRIFISNGSEFRQIPSIDDMVVFNGDFVFFNGEPVIKTYLR